MWHLNRNVPIPSQSQLSTILADFLRYHRTTHSRKANIHGDVFGATLNGQESPYKKKRSRGNKKPSKPCLCGDDHFWDPEKAKKIAAFEAADNTGILNKIREKNRRYKKQRSQGADKPAKSDSIEIDASDQPTDRSSHKTYAVFSSAFNNQSSLYDYPLLHSWTLDPATDIHICNHSAEFYWKAPAADDDIVLAGGSETSIEAWGEVTIPLSTPNSIKITTLKRVALIHHSSPA
ncbi:hypothetical protein EK21DRAFT_94852 [Setomelanomma holmii]|uniref:Uncharacterized protein n=1 Tax=Setomelanomma holmii TaxID=210430 RepID=A0A9P4GV86_9PLEO|nr:hypothetical protein EK21DRAFT_94852 [Setomelanomma holmii]